MLADTLAIIVNVTPILLDLAPPKAGTDMTTVPIVCVFADETAHVNKALPLMAGWMTTHGETKMENLETKPDNFSTTNSFVTASL
jgi:hypothetical protein